MRLYLHLPDGFFTVVLLLRCICRQRFSHGLQSLPNEQGILRGPAKEEVAAMSGPDVDPVSICTVVLEPWIKNLFRFLVFTINATTCSGVCKRGQLQTFKEDSWVWCYRGFRARTISQTVKMRIVYLVPLV
jgi:hypothetical protein